MSTGKLYVVATPIGNLEDITIRAVKVLLSVPIVACEDTRRTGQLLKILEEKYGHTMDIQLSFSGERKYVSVRDWNEAKMVDRVLAELEYSDVVIVSDAGTPLLSDPGFKVVRAAREAGVTVIPIPGPFAGAVALSAAGLPTNKFLFWGFLPKKWSLESEMTHVIYEAPTRVRKTVQLIREKYPSSQIVIARELTKVHEQFITDEQLLNMPEEMKGEMTILVYVPVA
jgi:16S rRNA (cytidine1402-2'-O)-methyltransferase